MHVENQVYRYTNLVGNVLYGYAGKYYLDATFSYSGTNRIQDRNGRNGFFPALAAAWVISNEPFMKNIRVIDLLKLRASYGIAGNGRVTISDLTSSKFGGGTSFIFGSNFTSASAYQETELGIRSKKFETSVESNVGIQARLFGKLDLSAEYFKADRKNIFVAASGRYSTLLGLIPLQVPEGEVENKGYEIELAWNDRIGGISYFVSGSFSQYKNRIINMNEEYRPYDYLKRTGHKIGQFFGLESSGFFSDATDISNSPEQSFGAVQPGDIKYVDQNRDGSVDEFDMVAIGNSGFPEIYYSASAGIGYRGIEISALFQGTGKSSAYLSSPHVFWPLIGNNNMSTWYTNYWSESNPDNAELPRLAKMSDNNYRTNDIWVRDNSYLKLRYAELSYSLPQSLLSRFIKLQQAKVYLRGTNLFCIDKIRYVDPENTGATYPSLRTYNAGIQIVF
jgi:TonB-linked SusC/RagA family outer membrane protein